MRILYGIQGTGHGHISRARELLPELSRYAEVDVLISGYASQLELEEAVTYRKHGVSFAYDENGGVSIFGTLKKLKPVRFIREVNSVELADYDLVISDYEPVTAWAAKLAGVPSVALSHQAAFLSERSPRPSNRSATAEAILQHFAPTDYAIGFHFRRYDNFIEPPIIRSEIRSINPTLNNHITVYLPAYHHARLAKLFKQFQQTDWHIFSPSCQQVEQDQNIWIHPISNERFTESLCGCRGVITSAGFETSSEAMYLNKKLMVIPIKNQYEQQCNAAALKSMGVTVELSLLANEKVLEQWLHDASIISLNEAADTIEVVSSVLDLGKTSKPENNSLKKHVAFS